MRNYIIHVTCLIFCTAGFFIAPAQKTDASLYEQTSEVNNLMVQYNADSASISRFYFIRNAPERRARLKKMNEEYLASLEKMNFVKLPVGSRVDYILFRRNLLNEIRLLEKEEKEYIQISKWVPFADSIYIIEKLRRRGASLDAMQLAEQITFIQKQIPGLSKKLAQETEMSMQLGDRASNTVKGLQAALKSIYDFYNGYDPQFSWWVPLPYKAVDSELNGYAAELKAKGRTGSTQKEDRSGIVGNPIGREELLQQLQFEMIPYSPEELIDIANKEFAWCDEELLKASREMGFGLINNLGCYE